MAPHLVEVPGRRGEGGAHDSTGIFRAARSRRGLDTLSVVNAFVLRCCGPVYCCGRRFAPAFDHDTRTPRHGQGQAYLPAQQSPPSAPTRVPPAYAHTRRTLDREGPPPQGPRAPHAHALTFTVHTSQVRRVYRQGSRSQGNRVVVLLAPGSGSCAVVASRRVGGAVQRNRAGGCCGKPGGRLRRRSGTHLTPSWWLARPSGAPRRRIWWPR